MREEQRALKIGRDFDVHGWRDRGFDARFRVGSSFHAAVQNVVLVGCDDQTLNREAHFLRNESRENIAKITCWNRKADLAIRRTQRNRSGEIINHLRQNTRPVD